MTFALIFTLILIGAFAVGGLIAWIGINDFKAPKPWHDEWKKEPPIFEYNRPETWE